MMFTEDEVRLLGLAAPQVLKMFASREERLLNKLYGDIVAGTDYIRTLTEWHVVRAQIHEIKTILDQHHKQEKKRHDTNPD